MRKYGLRCTNSYSYADEDTAAYHLSWLPLPTENNNDLTEGSDQLTDIQKAYIYSTESDINGFPYDGLLETYSGGGYVANLGDTLVSATDMINALESNRWIDVYTRAIFVEFNLFNPNTAMANTGKIIFEFPTQGNKLWSTRMEVVQLYRYTGPNGIINLLSEIACAIFVIVISILEARKIYKNRQLYFSSFWNWIQIIILILFFASVGLYTTRCLWTMWAVDDLMNNPGELIFNLLYKFKFNYYIVMTILTRQQ